jgi:hypothetical protein
LRGEKFTAPINRTKTYFVNRGSQLLPQVVARSVTVSDDVPPNSANARVDVHVHVHGLIRNDYGRLWFGANVPALAVLDIENIDWFPDKTAS